jgi:exodeoxyribonuclease V alpha subunit
MNKDIDRLLDSLNRTKFRGSFHLNNKMKLYVKDKGLDKIKSDAYDLINKRIAIANPSNDGKQTPMKQVHPVFIAQHATGTCCRGCIERIHHIPKGRELTKEEIDYIIDVIMKWIIREK